MARIFGLDNIDVRNNRLWMELTMTDAQVSAVQNILDGSDKIAGPGRVTAAFDVKGFKSIYLPLTMLPKMPFFKNEYERIVEDISIKTRAYAELAAGLARKAEQALNSLANNMPMFSGDVQAAAAGVGQAAGFIGKFTGNLDSPKVWKGTQLENFEMDGAWGFDSIEEYKYFKKVQIILQVLTTPNLGVELPYMAELAKWLGTNENDSILNKIRPRTYSAPVQSIGFKIRVWAADEFTIRDDGAYLSKSADPLLLFECQNAMITELEMHEGTDEGKGIDNRGVAHLVRYSFTYEPYSIEDMIKGIESVRDYNAFYGQVEALPVVDVQVDEFPTQVRLPNTKAIAQRFLRAGLYNFLNAKLAGVALVAGNIQLARQANIMSVVAGSNALRIVF